LSGSYSKKSKGRAEPKKWRWPVLAGPKGGFMVVGGNTKRRQSWAINTGGKREMNGENFEKQGQGGLGHSKTLMKE